MESSFLHNLQEFYIRMIVGFKFVYYDTEKNKITNRRNRIYDKNLRNRTDRTLFSGGIDQRI